MASNSSEISSSGLKKENFLSSFTSTFEDLRKSDNFCDIEIKIGDRTISAHRVILKAVAPDFYKSICSADLENEKKLEVVLNEIDADVFESLIQFCYSGEIEITSETAEKLLVYASRFELFEIRDACIEFITKTINSTNVLRIRRLVESVKCENFATTVQDYISNNFSEVLSSEAFLELEENEILEILGKENLKDAAEPEVYEAAMRWVKHSQTNRLPVLPEILKNVRLASLPSDNNPLNEVSDDVLIKKMIHVLEEVKNRRLAIKSSSMPQQLLDIQARQNTNEKIFVICKSATSLFSFKNSEYQYIGRESFVYFYDNQKWFKLQKTTFRTKSDIAFVYANQKIYLFGGKSLMFNWCSSKVKIFDLKTFKWLEGKKMLTERRSSGAATLDGCIYVCGGSDISSIHSSVERFSVSKNMWEYVAPLNEKRTQFSAVSLNGLIYAIGGWNGNLTLDSCEKYCPQRNDWKFVKPMETERSNSGAATLNGKIYVCGGDDFEGNLLSSCEVYDPETDSWSAIAPMQYKRFRFCLSTCNGKLYAIGGHSGNPLSSSMEEYCPVLDEWKFVEPLPQNAIVIAAVTCA